MLLFERIITTTPSGISGNNSRYLYETTTSAFHRTGADAIDKDAG